MSVLTQIAQRAASFADQGVGMIADAIEARRANPLRQALFHERMAAMLAAQPRRIDDRNGVRLRDARVRFHTRRALKFRARVDADQASGVLTPEPGELDRLLDEALVNAREAAPALIEAAVERDPGKARDAARGLIQSFNPKPSKR